jgi:hypothetical protein
MNTDLSNLSHQEMCKLVQEMEDRNIGLLFRELKEARKELADFTEHAQRRIAELEERLKKLGFGDVINRVTQ